MDKGVYAGEGGAKARINEQGASGQTGERRKKGWIYQSPTLYGRIQIGTEYGV